MDGARAPVIGAAVASARRKRMNDLLITKKFREGHPSRPFGK
jgi:hypothetical protein